MQELIKLVEVLEDCLKRASEADGIHAEDEIHAAALEGRIAAYKHMAIVVCQKINDCL